MDTVEFLPLGRASRSLGASYTSRRFLALGRDSPETLTSSFASSQEARKLVEKKESCRRKEVLGGYQGGY